MAAQVEATLDALAAKLTANLPAKITALNNEITDEFKLANPAIVSVGVLSAHDYPQVFVLPEESDPESDTGGHIVWRHQVRVVSFIDSFDEKGLTRLYLRYQRAVREVCLSSRSPGTGGGWGIRHLRDEYGPPFRLDAEDNPEMPFVQGAASLFEVRADQALS